MRKILLFTLLLFTFLIHSQKNKSTRMGLITLDELKMKVYDKDSTAAAVVLYEHANIYLDPDYDYNTRTDYYYRIKIIDKKAFDLSNIQIDLYKKNEVIEIKGLTYNIRENGTIDKTILDNNSIFEVDNSEAWHSKRFTLPNIKEGSVIEYKYSIISKYLGIDDWEFQSDIPKIKSEFDAAILGNYQYNIRIVGFQKLDKDEPSINKRCVNIEGLGMGACAIYSYGMNNIPAFKEEDYMLSKKNYLSRLVFDLKTYTNSRGVVTKYTDNWKNADKKLKNIFFNNQTSKKKYFKKRIPLQILEEPNELLRAQKIDKFVKNHFTWNDRFWNSNDEKIKDAFEDKTGTAGEINLSLFNSLQAADIECNLVILSTRNHGVPTQLYPVIFDFNYVIVRAIINGKEYYLDATDPFLPFGQIPERCLNDRARNINFKSESNWTVLKPKQTSSRATTAKLSLDENGEFSGSIIVTHSGYFGAKQRKKIISLSEDKYLEDFESKGTDIEVDDYTVNNLNDVEKNLQEIFKLRITTNEDLKDLTRVNPFLYERISKNPFQLKERKYPVDYGYTRKLNFSLSMQIPDNYEVKKLPEQFAIALPNKGGSFLMKVVQRGNIINLYSRLSISKRIFSSEEYFALKEFYNRIIQAEKSYIVLKKKS